MMQSGPGLLNKTAELLEQLIEFSSGKEGKSSQDSSPSFKGKFVCVAERAVPYRSAIGGNPVGGGPSKGDVVDAEVVNAQSTLRPAYGIFSAEVEVDGAKQFSENKPTTWLRVLVPGKDDVFLPMSLDGVPLFASLSGLSKSDCDDDDSSCIESAILVEAAKAGIARSLRAEKKARLLALHMTKRAIDQKSTEALAAVSTRWPAAGEWFSLPVDRFGLIADPLPHDPIYGTMLSKISFDGSLKGLIVFFCAHVFRVLSREASCGCRSGVIESSKGRFRRTRLHTSGDKRIS